MAIADEITRLTTAKTDIKTEFNKVLPAEKQIADTDLISTYSAKFVDIPTGDSAPDFTGSYDRAGLKEIGYTDEDVDYFNQFVTWNAADNSKYVLTARDKELAEAVTTIGDLNSVNRHEIRFVPPMDCSGNHYIGNNIGDSQSIMLLPHLNFTDVANISGGFKGRTLQVIRGITLGENVSQSYGAFSSAYALQHLPSVNLQKSLNVNNFCSTSGIKSTGDISAPIATNVSGFFSSCSGLLSYGSVSFPEATNLSSFFSACYSLREYKTISAPKAEDLSNFLSYCHNLTAVGELNFPLAKNNSGMFRQCRALRALGNLSFPLSTTAANMFAECSGLVEVGDIDLSSTLTTNNMFDNCFCLTKVGKIKTGSCTNTQYMFSNCGHLSHIEELDLNSITSTTQMNRMFYNLGPSLKEVYIKNCRLDNDFFRFAQNISIESIAYMINNVATTDPISFRLNSSKLTECNADTTIIAAKAAHPNVSLTT